MITDEMLRSSAARSSELFAHTIASDYDPVQQYEPSDLFEKKIRKLFHRAKHPYFYKAIRRVASIFLAAILVGSIYLAVDTEARASFLGWVKEVYETFFIYHYEGSTIEATPTKYSPSWIPEDYQEVFSDLSAGEGIIVYSDEAGRYLQFSYVTNPNNSNVFLGVENTTHHKVFINGYCADFFASVDPNISSGLAWIDASNHMFCISGFLPEVDLIKIAENIEKINTT